MIGVTNSFNNQRKYSIDNYTVFLMTDTIEDKSKFHSTFENAGVTVSSNVKRNGRNSLYFSGTNYIKIDKYDFCTEQYWTIEGWFYILNNQGGLFSLKNSSRNDGVLLFGYNGVANNQQNYMINSGYANWWSNTTFTNTGSAPLNQWSHRALVRNGSAVYVFQDGIYKMWTDGDYTWNIPVQNQRPILGGYNNVNNDNTCSHPCKCYIQDFRISNTARYLSNFTPPERFM